MRILIVSEMSVPYAVGGGEVRYALLARELARRGHEVTWLSMRQRQSPAEEVIEGVRHLHRGPRIPAPPSRPLFAILRFMATAFWHVLTHRYDVVDCQPYAPLPAVWLACLFSRQKMVATIHDTSSRAPAAPRAGAGQADGGDDQWLSSRDRFIVGPIETLLYRIPYRRIVTDTHGVRQTLARSFGVSDRRMVTVHCGIDTAAIAAAPAAAEQPAATVEFCGSLPDHASVIGRMKSARVLVLPSTREGFGLVLAEAMACGTPCVAYDVPAVREVLADGKAGVLVSLRDVEGLAAAIDRLLTDSAERERLIAAGGRQVAEYFAADRFAEGMVAVYAS